MKFSRLFSYCFATVFFFAGVAAGLGRGQIELNKLHAADQATVDALQAQAVSAETSGYWGGAYAVCIIVDENLFYNEPPTAVLDCNHAIADWLTRGFREDLSINYGYTDPTR